VLPDEVVGTSTEPLELSVGQLQPMTKKMGIEIEIIKSINWWHLEFGSKTVKLGLDMPDIHTALESLLLTHLPFSLCL
jgi:hypothetical protein